MLEVIEYYTEFVCLCECEAETQIKSQKQENKIDCKC